MGKRGVLLATAAALLAALGWRALAPRPGTFRDPGLSVLVVSIDTLRADALGAYGRAGAGTPWIDRLAKGGVRFERAYAHNVVTLPSHANLLSGQYPFAHGVRDNSGFRLPAGIPTLATLLQSRGWRTGAFVSAFPLDSRFGLDAGFGVYDDRLGGAEATQAAFLMPERRGALTIEAAVRWRSGQAGERTLAFVHLYEPHFPYEPPEPFAAAFAAAPYQGEVAAADAALEPLLKPILDAGADGRTLVVLTSDHGEALGDHGELTHGVFAYEATLRVPLLVWGAGISPGRDPRPVRHIDIAPTILRAVGAAQRPEQTGLPLLGGAEVKDFGPTYFESLSASVNRGWAPLRGILSGSHKYIDLPIAELYDLSSDPKEGRNLAGESSDALRRSKKLLEELPEGASKPGAVGTEEAARLRSLGYLAGGAEEKTTYGPQDDPKNLIDVDRQLHDVVDLFQRGQVPKATAIAHRVVAENPKMPIGYQQLAYLLAERGDLRAAIRVYEKAAGNGLRGETMDRRRALLLAEAGEPAAAAALLGPYSASDNGETLNALGIALTDLGRPQEGLPLFQRALALDSGSAHSYQNVGMAMLHLGRPEEARQNLEKSLTINQHNGRAWNALGVAWMRLNAPEKALDAWDKCIAANPEQYDALFNIGLVAMRTGDRARARSALERFAASAPPLRYAKDLAEVRSVLAVLRQEEKSR